jgi:xylose isomerase-like TIM barrel protein
MWFTNFKPEPGENMQDRKKRFNKWYLDKVEDLSKAEIVGNVHLVDAIGGSHQHLPAGQGELPLKEAMKILKKHGYEGPISSEGWGEERFGRGRIMTQAWKELGSTIYDFSTPMGGMASDPRWSSIQHSYLGRNQPPYFIFGAYNPSNDWTLWSEVPME